MVNSLFFEQECCKKGFRNMAKQNKLLKYRDLPWELRNQVDVTYGHIQRAQNPTIQCILKRLKKFEKMYFEEGADVSAREKREAIDQLENYMQSASL